MISRRWCAYVLIGAIQSKTQNVLLRRNSLHEGAALFAVLFFFCTSSFATLYGELSSLEVDLVESGLALFELIPDDNPENKVVRTIHIYTVSPFTEDSGFLTLLNKIHINTREDVVRQTLIQKEGEFYDAAAVRDSELALRALSLVRSTAVIVPVTSNSDNANEVDLLVVTRDLLSLRPTFNFKGSIDLFTNITIALGEHNLFGYNKSINAIYDMQQGQHIWSASYFDPRLFGSAWQLTVKPSVVLMRDTFEYDGMLGDFKLEKPLLSERDRWGYGLDVTYGTRSVIDFNGNKVRMFDIPTSKGVEQIERKYRWRNGKGLVFGKYSFGRVYKTDVFLRYGFNLKRPSIPQGVILDEEKRSFILKKLLPRDEFESYITLGANYFHNTFLTLYDYDNFKLQESKRTGPGLTLSSDFAARDVLWSDYNFIRPEAKLTYLQPFYKDSFALGSVSTSNRYDGSFQDNTYKYGLTLVSPKIFNLARVVFDGRLSTIDQNRDNSKFVLGSDSGIRGVESRAYSGDKGFRTNLEIRSAPVDLWIFHLGGVVFYDVGAAFDVWQKANATHALGFGLRFLAPQVSSVLFRFDLAFPIYGKGRDEHVVVPSFGTGQAF